MYAEGIRSEGQGFPGFPSTNPIINNLAEEPKEIGQVEPESTVEAAGVEASAHKRVMALDHHETFAFQTVHTSRSPGPYPNERNLIPGPNQIQQRLPLYT